MAREKCWEERK